MKSPAVNQAIIILRELRKISEESNTLSEKLNSIIELIVRDMKADAGALYLLVDDAVLEVFAAFGFNENIAHKITIRVGEGLVGEIASTGCSLSTSDVWSHPKFSYKSEMGEDKYKSFAGVPLLRNRKAVGVVTIQNIKKHEYSRLEMEILETVAMVLTEIVSSEEMKIYKQNLSKERGISEKDKFKGVVLSRGYGLGNAIIHRRGRVITQIFAENKEQELLKLQTAHARMNEDLDAKFNSTQLGIGEHADILDTYRMFAKDKGWYQKISDNVQSGLTAEAAVERAYEDMWNRLSGTSDQYLKERLNDLRDVSDRLQSYLRGDNDNIGKSDADDIIIIAQTMGPADLMDYDYKKIRGLLIEDGTPTMHVAIVAKALGLPVISKIKGMLDEIKDGQLIAIDGNEGYLYTSPSKSLQQKFNAKKIEKEQFQKKLEELKDKPSITKDKTKINLYINVGLSFDLDYIDSTNCDGVGLYRTEIPFMASDVMPDVSRQFGYYKDLMDRAGDRKVIFRSLDVGSDKLLPYWSNSGEENPAIGWRSIRITLDRRAILRKQMRAFLRAAADKELNVMFPMISNLSEFEEAKETLLIELGKEKKKSSAIPKKVNIGIMIEVPSVIFQLDALLEHVDFVSIGTNDLAQFIFACDRGNPRLSERYDVLSAPFLTMMHEIITKANKHGVYCSVCGEMASNPIEAMALIGLGYRNLSMSGSAFGKIKTMVRSLNVEDVSDYVQTLLKSQKRTLRPQLISYAHDHGIEI